MYNFRKLVDCISAFKSSTLTSKNVIILAKDVSTAGAKSYILTDYSRFADIYLSEYFTEDKHYYEVISI